MTANDELAARAEITTALLRYTRGIDRLDAATIVAAFHADAVLEGYGPKERRVEAFAPYAVQALGAAYRATQHRLTNTFIEFDGADVANVETYVVADHFLRDAQIVDSFAGRYLDRFEARDGRWAIVRRSLRRDWTRRDVISAEMPGAFVDSERG